MNRNWQEFAEHARSILADVPYGQREAALGRVFEESGWKDANTVRRAVAALSYLDELRHTHSELYEKVRQAPLSAVEALARLYRLDPTKARQAAAEWAERRTSLEALRNAARNISRPAGLSGWSGQALEEEYRKRAKDNILAAVEQLTGETVSTVHINYKASPESPTLDFLYSTASKPPEAKSQTIAVMIVGPYQNQSLYRKRRFDWMLRAFGLAWSYDQVVLVLPNEKNLADYNSWIAQYKQTVVNRQISNSKPEPHEASVPCVHVVSVEIPNMHLDEEAALSKLA